MTDIDTPPAGNEAEMNPTSLGDALASKQLNVAEEVSGSVGEVQADPTPAPADSAAAASAAAATQAPPAAQAGAEEPKPPKWYRDHMAKVNRELAESRAENERLRAAPPAQQPRPTPQQSNLPDPLEDPLAYAQALRSEFGSQMQNFQLQTTLTLSERFARQQHGPEAFEECRAWLSTRPDMEAWAIQQPDPWNAAFAQYQGERLREEIGDDPKAYEQRLREKILAELNAAQAAPAASNPAQPPTMRSAPPPPSSTARAAAPRDQAGRFTGPTPMADIFASRNR